MAGEQALEVLLRQLKPVLLAPSYVFCTIPEGRLPDCATLDPIGTFMEQEGLTLVVTRETAEKANLTFEGVFRCITLSVHSSLHAVGLTAAVATALAGENITANIIAGYFHDHLFVPCEDAERALSTLQALSLK